MASEAGTDLLRHARALERRDDVVARELARLRELSESVGLLRARVASVRESLESLPAKREQLQTQQERADQDLGAAKAQLAAAEARLAELQGSRRRRADELERAGKELTTAVEAHADAKASLRRIGERVAGLDAVQQDCVSRSDELARETAGLAERIQSLDSVAASTTRAPGSGLSALEAWASQARSALFVARGTLEQERERIVVEANALGSAVLGEQLGGSSTTVVRQRLEGVLTVTDERQEQVSD